MTLGLLASLRAPAVRPTSGPSFSGFVEHQDQRRGPPSRCPDLVRCILLFYGASVHCWSPCKPNDQAWLLERLSVLQGCRAGASAEGLEQLACKGHDAHVPTEPTVELTPLQGCSWNAVRVGGRAAHEWVGVGCAAWPLAYAASSAPARALRRYLPGSLLASPLWEESVEHRVQQRRPRHSSERGLRLLQLVVTRPLYHATSGLHPDVYGRAHTRVRVHRQVAGHRWLLRP